MGAETLTLGCRLNFAESEAMRGLAGDGDLIVNSCAVTHEAVRQTRQAIRRAWRETPGRKIIVTGCAAELDPMAFAAMPEVAKVIGNADKYDGSAFASENKVVAHDVMAASVPPVAAGFLSRVRSFVAVQTGCDHRCTFCSIWQARGPSRSLPYEAVRDALARELDAGAREIVLTGVDITDYEGGLGLLCQRLLADLPALQRLRLSSLDSVEVDGALLELVAGEARLLPHFHLSLQAGDDLILKRMKRRHSRAQSVATV
jgi:threonylcarbamoyladenosine tRNA methylthiotransferase MtaB